MKKILWALRQLYAQLIQRLDNWADRHKVKDKWYW